MALFVLRGVVPNSWRWPLLAVGTLPWTALAVLAGFDHPQLAGFALVVAALWVWCVLWTTWPHPTGEALSELRPGAPVRVEMRPGGAGPFDVRDRLLSVRDGRLLLTDPDTGAVDVDIAACDVTVHTSRWKMLHVTWPAGGCWLTPLGASTNVAGAAWNRVLSEHLTAMLAVPTTAAAAPAGWYPDPDGSLQPRWWDGHRWAPPHGG
jgi:hypothetical protein